MEKTILAIVRSRLNLGSEYDQKAHLVEHLFSRQSRLRQMGISDALYSQSIFEHNGLINTLFSAEYYCVYDNKVREIEKLVFENTSNLFEVNKDEFEREKSILIEELMEQRQEQISIDESLAKSLYTEESPTVINGWYNYEILREVSLNEARQIAEDCSKAVNKYVISYNNFNAEKSADIVRDTIRPNLDKIELSHPWQPHGIVDVSVYLRLPKNYSLAKLRLYSELLADGRFGLLNTWLREVNGLVYSVRCSVEYDDSVMLLSFSTRSEAVTNVLDIIKYNLKNEAAIDNERFSIIKSRLRQKYNLFKYDPISFFDEIIGMVNFANLTIPISEFLTEMERADTAEIRQLNEYFAESFDSNAIVATITNK